MDKIQTCLIVTADDFGYSAAVNRAVASACRQGILQCASLMVMGDAFTEAVELARTLPDLQVGLHLNVTEGKPLSSPDLVPTLLDHQGRFKSSLPLAGMSLYGRKLARQQMEIEVAAQFAAFSATGLPFHHVDCHHHFYIHPTLFDIVLKNACQYQLKTIRVPYESWEISGALSPGHVVRNWFYRKIFGRLGTRCRNKSREAGLKCADSIFGLYRTGEITPIWLKKLVNRLADTPGIFEIYAHPTALSDTEGNAEWQSLMDSAVSEEISNAGIKLVHYRDIED